MKRTKTPDQKKKNPLGSKKAAKRKKKTKRDKNGSPVAMEKRA